MHDKEKKKITLYTKRTEITIIKNIEFSSFLKTKQKKTEQKNETYKMLKLSTFFIAIVHMTNKNHTRQVR